MSIDHIPLPVFLYQNLFGKNLVDLKAIVEVAIPDEAPIHFLGGNEKQVILLFNDSQSKFLPDIHMKFLGDLLTACQLTMADIALVNLFHYSAITYRELKTRLQPRKILMFGISGDDLDLPFTIPFFQMQDFQEQVYMLSPSIQELQTNIELRKKLWGGLQKFFNIGKL